MKTNNTHLDGLRRDLEFTDTLCGKTLHFTSTWGIFSPREIDEGTRLLLKYVEIEATDDCFDLGCGYGPIGLTVASLAPQGDTLMVDKDFMAVEYANKNAAINQLGNAKAMLSNGFQHIDADSRFDVILSNVPAKVGKEMMSLLLHDALYHLKPGGRIYLVTINGLRQYMKRNLLEIFGNYIKLKQGPVILSLMQGVNDKSSNTFIRVCHDCDLIQHIPALRSGEVARCYRCGSVLEKRMDNSLDRNLALAITGTILFVVSNIFPLLSLKAQGVSVDSTLFSASLELYLVGHHLLGVLVFFTTILFPLLSLSGMIFVLTSVKFNFPSVGISPIFRFLHSTEIWGMLEVFLLAIIVAGIKLGDLAEVLPGISLYSFAGLIIILSLLGTSLNPADIWRREQQI